MLGRTELLKQKTKMDKKQEQINRLIEEKKKKNEPIDWAVIVLC